MSSPATVVNRSLDLIGRSDLIIGEMQEGTEAAQPALRAYGPAMRQLLRAANWGFARKMAPMTLLADATGQTPNVSTIVQAPWTYAYEYPIDCMKVRFLPWNSNPVQPNPPIVTGLGQPPLNAIRLQPAPFLISLDSNYPVVIGQPATWDQGPEWWTTSGEGPVQRTVILTNVAPQPQSDGSIIYPSVVYTCLVIYPSQWDSLFEEAMVNYLAQKLCMSLCQDKKWALQLQAMTIKVAKDIISEARAVNANESGAPQTIARTAEWIRGRNAGGGNYWGGGGCYDAYSGPGILYGGFDSLGWSDGSVY